jgi:hypothetical protein
MTHSFAVLGESCGNWQRQSDSVDEGKQWNICVIHRWNRTWDNIWSRIWKLKGYTSWTAGYRLRCAIFLVAIGSGSARDTGYFENAKVGTWNVLIFNFLNIYLHTWNNFRRFSNAFTVVLNQESSLSDVGTSIRIFGPKYSYSERAFLKTKLLKQNFNFDIVTNISFYTMNCGLHV